MNIDVDSPVQTVVVRDDEFTKAVCGYVKRDTVIVVLHQAYEAARTPDFMIFVQGSPVKFSAYIPAYHLGLHGPGNHKTTELNWNRQLKKKDLDQCRQLLHRHNIVQQFRR